MQKMDLAIETASLMETSETSGIDLIDRSRDLQNHIRLFLEDFQRGLSKEKMGSLSLGVREKIAMKINPGAKRQMGEIKNMVGTFINGTHFLIGKCRDGLAKSKEADLVSDDETYDPDSREGQYLYTMNNIVRKGLDSLVKLLDELEAVEIPNIGLFSGSDKSRDLSKTKRGMERILKQIEDKSLRVLDFAVKAIERHGLEGSKGKLKKWKTEYGIL